MSHLQTVRYITYALIVLFLIGVGAKLGGDHKAFDQVIAIYLWLAAPLGLYVGWVFFLCPHPERVNPHFERR